MCSPGRTALINYMTHRNILPRLSVLALAALAAGGCGGWASKPVAPATDAPAPPPALDSAAMPAESDASASTIRFLEDRIKHDPEDFIAYNKLCGYYLRAAQESGDLKYLELASRGAAASLKAMPAEVNPGGLAALIQAEYMSHDFAAARDHALRLQDIEPRKALTYQLLGEALLELGEYDRGEGALRQMERLSGPQSFAVETRLARVDLLRGRRKEAERRYGAALALALSQVPSSRETVAWCWWQLGEFAFMFGDYEAAERNYLESLKTFPDYYRALASLGRARAARGDLPGAIEQYERAVGRLPDPSFLAALGDLYKLAGRDKEAAAQYALVEQIARLGALNGALYNRQLALFYADHDMRAPEAYALAAKEYEVRRDIYGADALAWTALKAGKLDEARAAIKDALRLQTEDARLFYHAGMIARAGGDAAQARRYLERALALSPQFDPLQARIAREALTK